MAERTLIMDPQRVEHKLQRMARQIHEKHFGEEEVLIIGVREDGERIAERLRKILEGMGTLGVASASISIDKRSPLESEAEVSVEWSELDGRCLILVDDVVNSGKTLAHTTKVLLQRPVSSISTVALVDRQHHLFPIRADIVGTTLATTMKQHIEVEADAEAASVYLE
jgi:pyrimidine operon attenuation protein/uracil phosphoribosyltransferase